MARSPLVAQATRDLAKYFQAITDGTFIDRSWSVKIAQKAAAADLGAGGETQINASRFIRDTGTQNVAGTDEAEQIANLINGAVGIGPFFELIKEIPERYKNEFKFYRVESGKDDKEFKMKELESSHFAFVADGANETPTKEGSNVYTVNVYNPFMGPTTRDSGPVEIFMNAIPTLEFSRCVPYINFELITTRKEVGNSSPAPSLSMIGFLNPAQQGSADSAMLRGQAENVKSEVLDLGKGIRSGIELFTMPQTLVNLGPTGKEFVPVIDRFRPLASLDNLSLSTKMQGGTLSFTTGKIEVTVFDRSRLREVAAFVRPDLYGTTFLDITHGWSHPDGGFNSQNAFGKFLNALKTETRYRVSNSSFSFEEGGKIKISLSIQSVGSIDFLYLGPRGISESSREMAELCRALNERLSALNGRGTSPSTEAITTLGAFSNPNDVMKASTNAETLKEIKKAVEKLDDAAAKSAINELFGTITNAGTLGNSANSAVEHAQKATAKKYTEIINSLPTFGDATDPLAVDFKEGNRLPLLNINNVVLTKGGESEVNNNGNADLGKAGYVSYGSVFMKMVVEPMQRSGQYEEIQTIFYPFNDHAGAVHQLPISCFPIEKKRFIDSFTDLSKTSPELSLRDVIRVLQDRFVGFVASRPYLMAGFYDKEKIVEGIAEEANPNSITVGKVSDTAAATLATAKTNESVAETTLLAEGDQSDPDVQTPAQEAYDAAVKVTAAAAAAAKKSQNHYSSVNRTLTFENRLVLAGISDKKWVMPKVEVAVESSKLLDKGGKPIVDSKGNTKTLLKIHVYDSAMDPHSTLTDIIMAANDKGIGVIADPVAAYNAAAVTGTGKSKKDAAIAAIKAGIDAGVLKEIDIGSGLEESVKKGSEVNLTGTKYYAIADDYNKIKSLIAAGMPTITYGSSMSAITSANLTTAGNAAMNNVLLQRAFAPPGEMAPDNIDSGVPMQIIPASLSISTIGCPLFYPMQRFFIDFGTGTSLDSVYYVISTDTNIGTGGYKTDVKFAYSAGFATYTSLNQNLAMMAARLKEHTADNTAAATTPQANAGVKFKNDELIEKQFKNDATTIVDEQQKLEAALRAKADAIKASALHEASAKLAEAEKALNAAADNLLGEPYIKAKALVEAAKTQVKAEEAKIAELAKQADKTKKVAEKVAKLATAASALDPEFVKQIFADVEAARKEANEYTEANKTAEDAAAK